MNSPGLVRLIVRLVVTAAGLGGLALAAAAEAETRTLVAGLDYDLILQQSVPKYASLNTKAASKVTCVAARPAQAPNGYAACYVFAPGFHRDLPAGGAIITAGGGTVRLGCDGYPYPVDCEAEVDDQDVRPAAVR